MLKLRKGIRLESLNLPFKKALALAAEMGADGVEINARSEVKPRELSRTGERQIKKMLDDFQLKICCVTFPTRRGYGETEDLDRRIDATKAAMMMAYNLGCPVVSNYVGLIPDEESENRTTMLQALEDLGRHGQRVGSMFAIRTGRQSGEKLAEFVGQLSPGSVMMDFDPAELVMHSHDTQKALKLVGKDVVHFRARDAVLDLSLGQGIEVQLGRGVVDFPPLLAILEENNYQGFITVDRHPGVQTAVECSQSFEYLENVFG